MTPANSSKTTGSASNDDDCGGGTIMGAPFLLQLVLFSGYHACLEFFELGIAFKMYSFLLVTPLVKLKKYPEWKEWMFSVFEDTIICLVYYQVVAHLMSFSGFVLVALPLFLTVTFVLEYISFRLFAPADAKYVIKEGVDLRLLPAQISLSVLVWKYASLDPLDISWYRAQTSFWIFLLWTDLQFGLTHLITHRVPFLWKIHRKHHEYHREQLNLWASFYGDLLDVLQMVSVTVTPIVVNFILPSINPAPSLVYHEIIYMLQYTHASPLCPRAFPQMLFWEWEAMSILMAGGDDSNTSTSFLNYHPAHHDATNKFFGIWGIVPDWVCEALTAPILAKNGRAGTKQAKQQ